MSSHEAALNASNTDAVMPLYAEDGVFMAPNNQSAVGKAAVRRAYDAVFKAIMLKVKFTIAELVVISPRSGLLCGRIPLEPKRSMPLEPQAPKQTRSFSSSRRATTAGGRSPATAFPPPIRCKAVDGDGRLGGRLPAI
jgi:hypothetical protein